MFGAVRGFSGKGREAVRAVGVFVTAKRRIYREVEKVKKVEEVEEGMKRKMITAEGAEVKRPVDVLWNSGVEPGQSHFGNRNGCVTDLQHAGERKNEEDNRRGSERGLGTGLTRAGLGTGLTVSDTSGDRSHSGTSLFSSRGNAGGVGCSSVSDAAETKTPLFPCGVLLPRKWGVEYGRASVPPAKNS
jgi:hypothetical protein